MGFAREDDNEELVAPVSTTVNTITKTSSSAHTLLHSIPDADHEDEEDGEDGGGEHRNRLLFPLPCRITVLLY